MTTPTTNTPAVTEAPKPTLTSAKPLGELTPAERKQRYKLLRERMGESKLKVKGDPSKHYFWAHKDDGASIIELESKEYEIVREPNPAAVLDGKEKPKIIANGLKKDGTYIVGDVILMQCPLEVYEYLMLYQDDQMSEMKRAVKDDFKAESERVGAPTFEFSDPNKRS